MARPRQPIALIKAKGNKHLTKKEIEEREATELRAPIPDKVDAPDYIADDPTLVAEFDEIASQLLALGILTELDADALARYLLSKNSYLHFTRLLKDAIEHVDNEGILYIENIQKMQDKAFKQVRASASDLGLTISSRCRLVIPKVDTKPKENKFAKFSG